MKRGCKVHCLGALVVDALSGPLRKYPVPGKQTQVNTQEVLFMPGGGAANSGAALAQLDVPVAVFSKVGSDANGAFIVDALGRQGVETSGIKVSKRDTTPFTFVGIHPSGDRTFIHTPGANKTFRLSDLDENRLLDADILFYQDFWVLPKIDGGPAARLLEKAGWRGLVTILDECWGLGPDKDSLEKVLPFVDYFLPSYDDMCVIYPGLSTEQIIRRLHERGVGKVVLKIGKKGCLLSAGGKTELIPACAARVVDTTGAGDCFDAGFIAGLVHGLSDREAAVIGARAAGACIAHVGGACGIPRFSVLHKGCGR